VSEITIVRDERDVVVNTRLRDQRASKMGF
jgi:hypothetical protein